MTSHQAKAAAIDLVKAALEAGWMNGLSSGEKLAKEVNDAISGIAKSLED